MVKFLSGVSIGAVLVLIGPAVVGWIGWLSTVLIVVVIILLWLLAQFGSSFTR